MGNLWGKILIANDCIMKKINAVLIVAASVVVACLIANIGVDYNRMELGALVNLFGPPIVGVISILVFALLNWAFPKVRVATTVIFCLLNLIIALGIRAESNCC